MTRMPQDPMILLSWLNTRLRDEGLTLEELCRDLDEDPEALTERMRQAGFAYDAQQRRFR